MPPPLNMAAMSSPRSAFGAFLSEELALRPGRLAVMTRIAVNVAVIVAVGMIYQIPLVAYSAYAVFLISREETTGTVLTGVVAATAFTAAVALSLTFYMLDASEPALRLPLMAASTFAAMFFVRTATIGPIAFLAGFVLVLSQTLIDRTPNLEILTRLVLWLWPVAVIPIVLTIITDLMFGEKPARIARRTAAGLLRGITEAIRSGDARALGRQQGGIVTLLSLRRRANVLDHSLRRLIGADTRLIETLAEMLAFCPRLTAEVPAALRSILADACSECLAAFEEDRVPAIAPDLTEDDLAALTPEARPFVIALIDALRRLGDGLAHRRDETAEAAPHPAKAFFVTDAFSNPDHTRFALKVTLAVMAAYILYNAVDWPGISTAVTTCFFVALGSLGETMHKLTLRIGGAALGGLLGALAIVYALPQMTDIGQLCLLIAGVSLLCAWVATSSERLAYAGMQMAFAFFLGVLQDYAPATDLTVLRDRIAGILLGNILMSLVFSVLWPVSTAARSRKAIATAARKLADLLQGRDVTAGQRLAVVQALAEARRLTPIAAFERGIGPAGSSAADAEGQALQALDGLAAAVFMILSQAPAADALKAGDRAVAAWLSAWADRLSSTTPSEPPPRYGIRPAADLAEVSRRERAVIDARIFLQAELDHVHAAGF